jgi:hypothetical protein
MDLRVWSSKVTTQAIIQLLWTFLVWFNTHSFKNQYPCGTQHGLRHDGYETWQCFVYKKQLYCDELNINLWL